MRDNIVYQVKFKRKTEGNKNSENENNNSTALLLKPRYIIINYW